MIGNFINSEYFSISDERQRVSVAASFYGQGVEMTDIPDGIELTPFDDKFYSDPYEVYARLRSLDPVHRDISSFYKNSWTVTDFDNVRSLLRDKRLSVDSRKVGVARDPRADNAVTNAAPNMMNLDEPDHSRLRSLVQKAFTPSRVKAFRPRVEQIVRRQIDQIKVLGTTELVASYAKPIPTIVIAEFFGLDSADHELFKAWTDSLLKQGYPIPTQSQWDGIVSADKAFREYMKSIVRERKQTPKDDLITALVLSHSDSDKLSEDELVDMCCLLVGAGNFTTTDLISNSILALLQNPDQLALLREKPELIQKAVEEILKQKQLLPYSGFKRIILV